MGDSIVMTARCPGCGDQMQPTLPVQCPNCAERIDIPLDKLEFLHSGMSVSCPECETEIVFDVETRAYHTELHQARARVQELQQDAEFWMGEGPTSAWPLEEKEWRELASIDPLYRTADQTARLRELARAIRDKSDTRMNWARAERAQGEVEVLAAQVAALEVEIETLRRALGGGNG